MPKRGLLIVAIVLGLSTCALLTPYRSEARAVAAPRAAATYYIAADGNDSNSGTDAEHPWRTIDKVNGWGYSPGDTYNFKRGDTFSGNLLVDGSVMAGLPTAGAPLTFGAYGTGARPVINPGKSYGVAVSDCPHVRVRGLNVAGPGVAGRANNEESGGGVTTSRRGGLEILLEGPGDMAGVSVTDCVATGCYYGLKISVARGSPRQIVAPVVSGNTFSGNAYAGIYCLHVQSHDTRVTNPVIAWNAVHDNHGASDASMNAQGDRAAPQPSGWGMFLADLRGGRVQNNLVHDNGESSRPNTSSGPVGIMLAECNGTVVAGNEVYKQHAPEKSDGQGIDLDGGCVGCVVERNYVHDCDGAGFMDLDLGAPYTANRGNVFRWNVTQSNNRAGHQAAEISVRGSADCQVYNNTFFNSKGSTDCPLLLVENTTTAVLRNNIFSVRNGSTFGTVAAGTTLQGNCYDAAGGSTFRLTAGGSDYTGLDGLRGGGFEKVGRTAVGSTAAPAYLKEGGGRSYDIGRARLSLTAYDPGAGSAIATGGLDPATYWDVDAGACDFHGNANRTGDGLYPVGAVAGPAAP